MFLDTSVLTGEDVEEAFLKCARTFRNKIDSGQRDPREDGLRPSVPGTLPSAQLPQPRSPQAVAPLSPVAAETCGASSPVLQNQPCPSGWGPDPGPGRPSPSPVLAPEKPPHHLSPFPGLVGPG
uniref:ras-related protein Rab-4B-like n=1 Tax=Odobenus rosmarus divergens TaxID=9708 RepID=UPI00063CC1EA|nr:PREDICTED: ras-related protein Rab-4B-like [Odobenus rosmarus divergens]